MARISEFRWFTFYICLLPVLRLSNAYTGSTPNEWQGISDNYKPRASSQHINRPTGTTTWPFAHVTYHFHNLTHADIRQVYQAFNEYHRKTCVRFLPRQPGDRIFTSIEVNDSLCGLGTVCMYSEGVHQFVQFGNECRNSATMIHELGHNLCLSHEHQRADRDKYVDIKNCANSNYVHKQSDEYRVRGIYDYASQMHYKCGDCVVPKNKEIGNQCGYQVTQGLSVLDSDYINELYNCGGCFRHRWVPVKQYKANSMKDFIFPAGKLTACRLFVETEIVVGTFQPVEVKCYYVTLSGKLQETVNEEFEVLVIPEGMKTSDSQYTWLDINENLSNEQVNALLANAVPGGQMPWRQKYGHATGYIGYAVVDYTTYCIHSGYPLVDLMGSIWRFKDGLKNSFPIAKSCGEVHQPTKIQILVCKSFLEKTYTPGKMDMYRNWRQRYSKTVDLRGRFVDIRVRGYVLPKAKEIYFDIATQPAGGDILFHLRLVLHPNYTASVKSSSATNGWVVENKAKLESKYWCVEGNSYTLHIGYVNNGQEVAFDVFLNGIALLTLILSNPNVTSTGFFRIHGDTTIDHVDIKDRDLHRPANEIQQTVKSNVDIYVVGKSAVNTLHLNQQSSSHGMPESTFAKNHISTFCNANIAETLFGIAVFELLLIIGAVKAMFRYRYMYRNGFALIRTTQ